MCVRVCVFAYDLVVGATLDGWRILKHIAFVCEMMKKKWDEVATEYYNNDHTVKYIKKREKTNERMNEDNWENYLNSSLFQFFAPPTTTTTTTKNTTKYDVVSFQKPSNISGAQSEVAERQTQQHHHHHHRRRNQRRKNMYRMESFSSVTMKCFRH